MLPADRELEEYILNHIDPEDPVLYELFRTTHVHVMHPRMISGHLQGKILRMLSLMIRPSLILEIGTYTGYSAICLAQGLSQGGHLHTIEQNDEITDMARSFFARMNLNDSITLHTGDARNIIPTLFLNFDLVFIDGEKSEYLTYYELIIDYVRPGGFILADNILWDGKILSSIATGDHFTKGIARFNQFVKDDPRVEKVILPIRDGLMILRKI